MLHELTGKMVSIKKKNENSKPSQHESIPQRIDLISNNPYSGGAGVFGAKDFRLQGGCVTKPVHLTAAGMSQQTAKNVTAKPSTHYNYNHYQNHNNYHNHNHTSYQKGNVENSFFQKHVMNSRSTINNNRPSNSNPANRRSTGTISPSNLNKNTSNNSGNDKKATVLFCYPIGQTKKEIIEAMFSKHGRVLDLQVKHDWGGAFVHMADPYEAFQASMALNGHLLNGQTLQVSVKE